MIFQLDKFKVIEKPFPHIVLVDLVSDEDYAEMQRMWPHPDSMQLKQGRKGFRAQRSLYACDGEAYRLALEACPQYQQFNDSLQSPEFISFVAEHLRKYTSNCLIQLERCEFVDHAARETRYHLSKGWCPKLERRDQVFVRTDFEEAHKGYVKPVHVDAAHRWFSMIYFMEDAEESEFIGGNLSLHPKKNAKSLVQYRPRHNCAILYPRRTDSWHSVDDLQVCNKPRKFLFCTASSTMPIWPRA